MRAGGGTGVGVGDVLPALEIEITRSALNRMALYASLGVPEVWRFDGTTLCPHLRQADGTYQPGENSLIFPGVPLDELARLAEPDEAKDILTVLHEFRAWVRSLGGTAT